MGAGRGGVGENRTAAVHTRLPLSRFHFSIFPHQDQPVEVSHISVHWPLGVFHIRNLVSGLMDGVFDMSNVGGRPSQGLRMVQVGFPEALIEAMDAARGQETRVAFIRSAVEGMLAGEVARVVGRIEAATPGPAVRVAPRLKPVAGSGLVSQAMAGREVVDSADKRRVLDCLGERRRSARDVAVALKMDFGTAGLVIADLVRDGLVRKPEKGGVLELVE
jgi:hypothetical protein